MAALLDCSCWRWALHERPAAVAGKLQLYAWHKWAGVIMFILLAIPPVLACNPPPAGAAGQHAGRRSAWRIWAIWRCMR